MVTIKLFSLGVIATHVMVVTVLLLVASSTRVDAFSSRVAVNQRTRTRTQTRTRIRIRAGRQPSSLLLPPLSYLMREGDDEFVNDSNGNSNNDSAMKMKTTTIVPNTIIPTFTGTSTSTSTSTSTDTTINLVDEKMIDDLQNQHDEHLQMMQHQQQHDRVHQQQQSLLLSYSVTDPLLPTILFPSTAAPTTAASLLMTMMSSTTTITATVATATMNKSKNVVGVGVGTYDKLHEDLKHLNMRLLLHRWFPNTKKQHIERLVHLLIKYIL